MARRSHSEYSSPSSRLNLTPLIDMAFILLIFFIVSASLDKEHQIAVERPLAATAEPAERPPLRVQILADGTIVVDDQMLPVDALRPLLIRQRTREPALALLLIADRQAPTGRLIEVMDQARLAGIAQIAVAAERSAR